jgi:hypothetical protein
MSWSDKIKATALAALAERATTAAPAAIDTRWTWDAHEVWLSRVKPPRDIADAQSTTGDASEPLRPGPAPRD